MVFVFLLHYFNLFSFRIFLSVSIFCHSFVFFFLLFFKIRTFRCTLTSIPQTQALLNKARLPLGLLLHPFRDLQVHQNSPQRTFFSDFGIMELRCQQMFSSVFKQCVVFFFFHCLLKHCMKLFCYLFIEHTKALFRAQTLLYLLADNSLSFFIKSHFILILFC